MAPTIYGKLSDEDISRLRLASARLESVRLRPSAYSRMEVEDAFLTKYRLFGEIATRYGVPSGADIQVDYEMGEIYEGRD